MRGHLPLLVASARYTSGLEQAFNRSKLITMTSANEKPVITTFKV